MRWRVPCWIAPACRSWSPARRCTRRRSWSPRSWWLGWLDGRRWSSPLHKHTNIAFIIAFCTRSTESFCASLFGIVNYSPSIFVNVQVSCTLGKTAELPLKVWTSWIFATIVVSTLNSETMKLNLIQVFLIVQRYWKWVEGRPWGALLCSGRLPLWWGVCWFAQHNWKRKGQTFAQK